MKATHCSVSRSAHFARRPERTSRPTKPASLSTLTWVRMAVAPRARHRPKVFSARRARLAGVTVRANAAKASRAPCSVPDGFRANFSAPVLSRCWCASTSAGATVRSERSRRGRSAGSRRAPTASMRPSAPTAMSAFSPSPRGPVSAVAPASTYPWRSRARVCTSSHHWLNERTPPETAAEPPPFEQLAPIHCLYKLIIHNVYNRLSNIYLEDGQAVFLAADFHTLAIKTTKSSNIELYR